MLSGAADKNEVLKYYKKGPADFRSLGRPSSIVLDSKGGFKTRVVSVYYCGEGK